MDLRLIATMFTTLFLAELGDKTQLAVLSLTASSKQPLAVFIQKAAAVAFIAISLIMFVGKSP